MKSRRAKNNLSWRRVCVAAILIAAVVFGSISIPLVRNEIAAREIRRTEAIFATGLSPCEHYDAIDVSGVLMEFLPATPTTSITVWPSFSSPVAIRLVGNELYYFVLEFPPVEVNDQPQGRFNLPGVSTMKHSQISAEIAHLLPMVLRNDIAHASARLEAPLDGTTYYFQTSPKNCAMTHSPRLDTRAALLTGLFDELVKQIDKGPSADAKANEIKILAILRQLESN